MDPRAANRCRLAPILFAFLTTAAAAATSEDPSDPTPVDELPEMVVTGRGDDLVGVATAASEGRIGAIDFELRPLLRPGELLETVPGLIATQHSGDGKGNQLFLRGFNLDHGTDFATFVEGMPVNLPTNAHGQGYTDVNFLIPELVTVVDYQKGTYYANVGDFSGAGAARFTLSRELDRPFVKVEAGADDHARVAGAASRPLGAGTLLVGGDVRVYDGPWLLPMRSHRSNAMARYTRPLGDGELSLLALGYDADWISTDQIPLRAVESGDLDRFGTVDSTDGGETQRLSLSASWNRRSARSGQKIEAYLVRYELDLFSNFSYFLEDTVRGDQFEQVEERWILGASASDQRGLDVMGREHRLRWGVTNRTDILPEIGLYKTERRDRFRTVRDDEVLQTAWAVHTSLGTPWTDWLRTELGVRADYHYFDVTSNTIEENSGTASDAVVSPKASVVLGPWSRTELYLNGGTGYHSNDARGTTINIDPDTDEIVDPVDPLVQSRGAEVGLRTSPGRLRSSVSVWWLELDSELLYVGDVGTTEPSGESRRMGVEWATFFRVTDWLNLDLDVSISDAEFADVPEEESHVPGALEQVLTFGASVRHPSGWMGALRVRHLGEYPLIEDDSVRAEATTLVNAMLGFDTGAFRIAAEVLNLTDTEDSDIQYFYGSRLPGEPAAGVEDVHVHPAEPRQLRVVAEWRL
jgi:hypothetical protein